MTRLDIMMIVLGLALMLSGLFTIYLRLTSQGLHPFLTIWMIFLSFAVAGLSFAKMRRLRRKQA
jgi:hypothetical protein